MLASRTTPDLTYQLKITISSIRPAIWRHVRVPGRLSLLEFHEVIQGVFGWTDSHRREFMIGGTDYGLPDDFDGMEAVDERKVRTPEVGGKMRD